MATTVTYKGETLTTVQNATKTLQTAGTWVEDDFTLTDVSGGTSAITVTDTPDPHGGIIKEITALDISDTTAVAGDVKQGEVFYTADGTRTVGTAFVGGWSTEGIGQGTEPNGNITYTPTSMVEYAFNLNGYNSTGITGFNAPNLLEVPTGAFQNARKLVQVILPVATSLRANAFNYAKELTSIYAPLVEKISWTPNIVSRTKVTTLVFPSVVGAVGNDALAYNDRLTTLDLGAGCTGLNNRCLSNNIVLSTLILRSTSVVPVSSSSLSSTPAASGGAGMTIYVPADLLYLYPNSTNWSTYNSYGTLTFLAIEGSYYATHYADGSVIA